MKVYLKISKKVKNSLLSCILENMHWQFFLAKNTYYHFLLLKIQRFFYLTEFHVTFDNKDDVPAASHLGLKQKSILPMSRIYSIKFEILVSTIKSRHGSNARCWLCHYSRFSTWCGTVKKLPKITMSMYRRNNNNNNSMWLFSPFAKQHEGKKFNN